MRVAINLLTDDPANPSGAHWFWTRMIPEMANLLGEDEEFRLLVSPKSRPTHQGYGPKVGYITFPWSNEKPKMRTIAEHLYAPVRLPASAIDVFSTLLAPIVRPAPGLVVHIKTMHAHTEPQAVKLINRLYRQLNLPRTVKVAKPSARSIQAPPRHARSPSSRAAPPPRYGVARFSSGWMVGQW